MLGLIKVSRGSWGGSEGRVRIVIWFGGRWGWKEKIGFKRVIWMRKRFFMDVWGKGDV